MRWVITFAGWGATELLAAYDKRELSPREVFAAVAARIEMIDPLIGALTTLTLDRAERDATVLTAELARGAPRRPLHGVPVVIKELFDVEGSRTTYGSVVFRERVARDDAEVVRRLRNAGALIIGLARSHEFGWGITTQHSRMGGTRNPWDCGRVPGGSSGGSAAAVAAALVPLALGSDTGGSIRIPAGYCGVAGLKPSYGRVSKNGGVPLAPSLDHPGFIARDVRDLAIALAAVAGYDPEDPTTSAAPFPNLADIDAGLGGLRIGLAPDLHLLPLAPDHAAIFESVIAAIERAGGDLKEVRFPGAGEIRPAFTKIQMGEAWYVHTRLLGIFPSRAEEYESDVRARLEAAAAIELPEYLAARQVAARIKRQFEILFAELDVLLTPIAAGGPPSIDHPDVCEHRGVEIPFRDLVMNYTVPQNLAGLPACAIRAGFDRDGMPVGIQITAPSGREDLALRVARSLQMILDEVNCPTPSLLPSSSMAV